MNCKTANSIWVKLAAQYLQNASASTHVLQARFFHYQFPKRNSMMSHITAAQQLKDLGSPTPQSQIMTKIVSTLPTAFRNFMTVRDNLPEAEKTMTQLITKLMNEQHRNVCKSPSSNPPTAGKDDPRNQEDLPRIEENELSSQTFSFAVGHADRFCQNPGKAHWSAIKRILSYPADSDYAGDKDTRRSTSGFIVPDNHAPLFYHRGGIHCS